MPSSYTHFCLAKTVLTRLPDAVKAEIVSLPLYFFGSQGADFCFFYRALHTSELNFGRFLHGRGSYDFFVTAALLAKDNPKLLSYLLGYVTHYAADSIFHPYVYHLSGKSPVKHTQTEGALDYYFSRKIPVDGYAKYFNAKLSDGDKSELYTLYSLAAARAGRLPLLQEKFFKCISNYLSYTALSARCFAREREGVANPEHREWRYPKDETKVLNDGADELFSRSADESLSLIELFLESVKTRTPPPKAQFGKNFLSGL